MEKLEEKIKAFLAVNHDDGYGCGNGYGYGSGNGYGDGSGDGNGYGYGSGNGYGDGSGDGYGYGSGYGYRDDSGYGSGYAYGNGNGDGSGSGFCSGDVSGIPEFNGQKVFIVDCMPTIIDSVHGNYVKGSILNMDFTLTPCYVARVEDSFGHGKTLKEAFEAAQEKTLQNMPLEQRIEKFKEVFPDPDTKIPVHVLSEWHHILTGSCKMGRETFAREHGIDIDSDSLTVREFIGITNGHYGSDSIVKLAKSYSLL